MPHTLSILAKARLPVMPHTARQVRALLASPRSTNAQLEAVLLCDPAATLALYRATERLRRGAVDELTGPAHALSLIGREAFRQAFEKLPEMRARPLQHILSPAFAYSQAAHAGWYAEHIGRLMGFGHPVEMRVAALLQHPAVLALWTTDFEAAARATNAMRDGVGFSTAFTAERRRPLKEVNRLLAIEWSLPRLAREVAGDWDPASRLPQSVSLAVRLALVAAAGWPETESRLHAEVLAGLLPHHHRDAEAWWHRQAVAAARALHPYGYPLPARELLLLPGGEEEVELPPLRKRRAAPAAPSRPGLAEVLAEGLRRVQQTTGLGRVLLVMPDRDRRQLRTRLALGLEADHPLRRLVLPARRKHLFALLLAKPGAVWIRADNRDRYAPYLETLPLDETAEKGFYAMSLHLQGRPLGVLYGDHGSLGASGFETFQAAGRDLIASLEALRRQAA